MLDKILAYLFDKTVLSKFTGSKRIIGIVIVLVGLALAGLQTFFAAYVSYFPEQPWAVVALTVIGALITLIGKLDYLRRLKRD